jgi:hypothetical protein
MKGGMDLERLTGRDATIHTAYFEPCFAEDGCSDRDSTACISCKKINIDVCERLAEYEDIGSPDELRKLQEALKGAIVIANEAQSVMKAKKDGLLIELPVPIGGTVYIPYKIRDVDGSILSGVEIGKLTGYIDENGRKFHTYFEDGSEDVNDVPINDVFTTPEEALAALGKIEVEEG